MVSKNKKGHSAWMIKFVIIHINLLKIMKPNKTPLSYYIKIGMKIKMRRKKK
jgi:hypothetical protein